MDIKGIWNKKYWGYHEAVVFSIVGKVKNGVYKVDAKSNYINKNTV